MRREQRPPTPNLWLYYSGITAPGRIERGPRIGFACQNTLMHLEPCSNCICRVLQERALCFAVDGPEVVVHYRAVQSDPYRNFVWVPCLMHVRKNPKLHATRTLCGYLQNREALGVHAKYRKRGGLDRVDMPVCGV